MSDRIGYRRIIEVLDVFADDLGEGTYSVSFEPAGEPGIEIVLDRATLERLRDRIAHALSPLA